MTTKEKKFNFWVPLELKKGETKDGKKVMKVAGTACTTDEDSDGENLFAIGFDVTPLLTSGFINYNHQANKNPAAIIGQPTVAKLINNNKDLYIEAELYPSSPLAQSVYNQIEILKRDSPDRQMGWSLEGIATQRDPLNNKRVLAAQITGMAITASPKNKNTLVNIIKGEDIEDISENIEPDDISKIVKTLNFFTVDPTNKDKVMDFIQSLYPNLLDNQQNIELLFTELNKSMSVSNIPVMESVEKKVKNTVEKQVPLTELNYHDKTDSKLTKSIILDTVVGRFNNLESHDYERIVKFTENYAIKKSMEYNKLSILSALDEIEETLTKGLDPKSNLMNQEPEDLSKKEPLDATSEEDKTLSKSNKDNFKDNGPTGEDLENMVNEDDINDRISFVKNKANESLSKSQEILGNFTNINVLQKSQTENVEILSMLLNHSDSNLIKSVSYNYGYDELEKGNSSIELKPSIYDSCLECYKDESTITTLSEDLIRQGFGLSESMNTAKQIIEEKEKINGGKLTTGLTIEDVNVELRKSLEPIKDILTKSMNSFRGILNPVLEKVENLQDQIDLKDEELEDRNNELIKANEEKDFLSQEIKKLQNQPVGRKSVSNLQALERFEKSSQAQELNNDTYDMHVPADRKNLSELLLANYKLGSQAGKPDSVLEKSISSVEIMGSVPKEAGPLMKALGITILNNVQ